MAASKPHPSLLLVAIVGAIAVVTTPQVAYPQKLPPYATSEEKIQGRIRSVDGQYHITVRDDNGYLDSVALHEGTLINPAGLHLAPRMNVTILGFTKGSVFVANEIDAQDRETAPPLAGSNGATNWTYSGDVSGAGYGQPRALYYAPSTSVYVTGGYPAYGGYGSNPYTYNAYGYGWPYRAYPAYSPFGYGVPSWGYPMYGLGYPLYRGVYNPYAPHPYGIPMR
ncbi:MAG: hypothetical protein JOY87_00480 [Candidatus Eremiobacteraeota bacterium]|nr:hypothetical protein [Candidatus Eremiobacteraeota bacterium]